jgi:ankyrin repeat protein
MGRKIVMGQNPRMSLASNKRASMYATEPMHKTVDQPTPAAHPVPDPAFWDKDQADPAARRSVPGAPGGAGGGGGGAGACFGMSPAMRMADACARRDWRAVASLTRRHAPKVLSLRVGDDGWSPLHLAAVLDEAEVAALMLQKGADPNDQDYDLQTPLHAVVNRKIAEQLVQMGANVDCRDRSGFTPLHVAAADGHPEIAELLLAHGADVDAKDNNGRTPLHEASSGGHFEVAEQLFAKGASVDPRDEAMGWTPLHLAVQHEYIHIMVLLMKKGADINAWDASGYTSLHLAAMGESKEIADALIKSGATRTLKNVHGQTARDIALQRGVPAVVELFKSLK